MNDEFIVEIKGTEFREKTQEKKIAGKKIYEKYYLFLNNIEVGFSAKTFYNLMKEKYGDRLQITYNQYEEKDDKAS